MGLVSDASANCAWQTALANSLEDEVLGVASDIGEGQFMISNT
jgi:hypothetical protein